MRGAGQARRLRPLAAAPARRDRLRGGARARPLHRRHALLHGARGDPRQGARLRGGRRLVVLWRNHVRAAHGLHALPGLKGGRDLPRDPVALFRLPAVALRHLGRGGRHGRPHAQPEPARAAHRRPHRDGAPLLCRRRLGGARCARRPAREPAAAGAEPADDAGARRDGAGAARLARRGGPAPFSRRLRGHPLGRGPIRRRPLDG
mmetsp:Transcript_26233/g.78252  ORF Transcript_26233/g.78252 Transcript_26233/m.78252 type:complete len:205 (-) Transcript_26233:410-1024(-)